MESRIMPCLWFDTQAEEAANFYISVFPNSRILDVSHYGEGGPREAGMVMTVRYELNENPFLALNGGPQFKFDEAVSFTVTCDDQAEIDHYWERLSEGGRESQCGWLDDRFGVAWQIVPKGMGEIFAGADPGGAQRAMKAMLGMRKLDLQALRDAAAGE
ncbi:MAG TPA: VOC family protein [Solirubrobacteraceae bacterium]|nr:VOC family protein [Solirubrobacteraceae bacterium]